MLPACHRHRARAPADRRDNIGEAHLQLGLGEARAIRPGCAGSGLDRGLVGLHGCVGGVAGGEQLTDALSRDHAERSELPGNVGFRLALFLRGRVSRHNRTGLLLHRGVAFEVGLLFQHLPLQRLAIDAEEQLAPGYILSFHEGNTVDRPGDARLYLDAVHRLDIADCRDLQRNIFQDRADCANRNRLSGRGIRLGRYAGAGCQRKTEWCSQ